MMFAGMIKVESNSTHKTDNDPNCQRCAVRAGGASTAAASGSYRRRSFRWPGYMRVDAAVGLAAETPCDSNKNSITPICGPSTSENTQKGASELPSNSSEKWLKEDFQKDNSSNDQNSSKTCSLRGIQVEDTSRTVPPREVFNSSFSFIQQSLETSDLLHDTTTSKTSSFQFVNKPFDSTSWDQLRSELSSSDTLKPQTVFINKFKEDSVSHSEINPVPLSQSESEVFTLGQLSISQSVKEKGLLLDKALWLADLDMSWRQRDRQTSSVTSDFKESIQDSDSGSLDTEVTSLLSVDSSDSGSSITSGYDSASPSSGQSRGGLMKKYENVLQDCLQNNRTNTKIESIMLKLQRLQHKAVLDDDYDTAEHFGKKLEDLRRERATLKPGLPSRHPEFCGFLERLRTAVHRALQMTDNCRQNGESSEEQGSSAGSHRQPQTREQLVQEKLRIQKEMCELQRRLEELQVQSRAVEVQLLQEERVLEVEEAEGSVLTGCDAVQLRLIGRALEDMMTSENRAQISMRPPAQIIRLQEQERALSLTIKEATAKVVMSQRLGNSLWRKLGESETQLLALHEAKLTAISGNDFSTAKELKAEIRNMYSERDHLEGQLRKLKTISTGSGPDLTRMKCQHNQIKLELQQREDQYERSLKENTLKYIELLEDRLHSCGSSALEHILEADLEACHLLLRSLERRMPSLSESDDLLPSPGSSLSALTFIKGEADCAMLTALGGRWCPDADLQHSEFTKKLEEFLFCFEDSSSEDLCGEVLDLTERCELIGDRLCHLEDQLQTAIDNQDKDLTLSLEKEVQELKATLQSMLSQLMEDEEEEDEDEDKFCDVEEEQFEEEDIEEEHYFSDSWEI
ncbi:disrupted in schizophrenia 1 protein-like isoform X2 [Myxocyprinus asiaticus]|uniref:disrupted in schizophrenia 1 protein-like isoform X2 n=1 Tax=Myxocyprinus asiaticus TaxID=70543 RepID=UPI002221BB6F|nr:disrupted in schizophrenia 1 protein-like isoform X2 [Myxocyprinus asiaticus]